ncbi:DUF2200 family protein [Rhizobium sp. TH2]|nr:DUF2200 family protein [Rhizobium sp. TH2]
MGTAYRRDADEWQARNARRDDPRSEATAPRMNPSRSLIAGVIRSIRVEEIEEPVMREIRYLDKLIDELAKGKAMSKILR